MRKRYTQAERDELVRAVTIRREPVTAVAARMGVTEVTAYRWIRAAAEQPDAELTTTPRFVELVPATRQETRLVVRVGAAVIEVRSGFDAELLRAIVGALGGEP
jgi:transposase-like protein